MQLNDLDILGSVKPAIGKYAFQHDANPSEKHAKDERDEKNDSDQREDRDDQISNVVPLTHRGRFVPRDLGFGVYGVEKRMGLAAPDGAGDNIDQRSAAPDRKSTRLNSSH